MRLLTVSDVGKAFRSYSSEWKRIGSWFGLPFKPSDEAWVLKNINFYVDSSEAVAIVGQNGAGKSTLLKIITGTLLPSAGSVTASGRIAAILELGMGFNPDLTGRQNVYHAASIMGFGYEHVEASIEQIQEFAEIGGYFDEPVRTYSSGMQMRVAFSVATAWRPEILIVDEALSVGDAYFQHKCFNRIREFQNQGTTLLIVSHDKGAIQALCDRAILLEGGAVIKDGRPEEIMDYYNAIIAEKENATIEVEKLEDGSTRTSSGTGEASIESVSLHNADGEAIEFAAVGDDVSLRVKARVNSDIPELVVGYMIKDRLGQPVYGTNTHHLQSKMVDLKVGEVVEYRFFFSANLGVGSYSVAVALHTSDSHVERNYVWQDLALIFNAVNTSKPEFSGLAWLQPTVECIR